MPKKRAVSTSKKNLPTPPSLARTIGPSFILLGLALGSGELLLWPYLAANYGLGLLWGALLGVTFQYFLNTEVMRYSLARGESVFVGFRQLSILIPVWFIISTFIPWSMPGFSSAASQILSDLFPFLNETLVAVLLLLLTGVVLTSGKTLYKTMEVLQKSVILIGLPLILLLVFLLTNATDWTEAGWGLLGRGDGWWLFPPGVALTAFLGAFAYSGAGGNLNLAQSYYIKEKGFGMGKYGTKITSLLSGGNQSVKLEGEDFSLDSKNKKLWQKWWRLVNTEHFLVFWILGFVTILVLSVLAKSLVFHQASGSGISFIYQERDIISSRLGSGFGLSFLLVAALMLFSTQLGVLESSSRIISENILLLFYKKGMKFNLSLAFYIALWGQILLGIVMYLFGLNEPRFVITLSAILNAIAMMVSFPLIFWLNKTKLPASIQPGKFRKIWLLSAFVFFIVFVILTIFY